MFKVEPSEKIDKNYFIKYMEQKGCLVNDLQKEKHYFGMVDYLVTDKETCSYLISYATFSDENILDTFFERGKEDVLQGNTNIKGSASVSINLFSEYYQYTTIGDYYKAIVYKDNSILYVSADRQYKNEVMNIFEDLHYNYEVNFNGIKVVWYSIFIVLVICIVSMWGTFKKTRNNGWISLIPFYNICCLSKDILGSYWYALFLFLPVVNVVFMFILYYNIGKVFNKSVLNCILIMFIPFILWPLFAFDNSEYNSSKVIKKINNI